MFGTYKRRCTFRGGKGANAHLSKIFVPTNNSFDYRVEKKPNPLQAWTDPEGSRRLRLPDFKTVGT